MLSSFVPPPLDLGSRPKPQAQVQRLPRKSVGSIPGESISNPIVQSTISLEYASLHHKDHCPLGMYIVPSTESLLIWHGVLFVHQGYYADAVLKFRLTFPSNYPEQPPAVHFITDVFHPMIGQDGLFNLTPRLQPWRPAEHRVFDVLHWIKSSFKKKALDAFTEGDCLNKEAYSVVQTIHGSEPRYHESTSSFSALAAQSATLSISTSALFDRDHPSLAGQGQEGFTFQELEPKKLQAEQARLGIQPWT
ncbi:hypothetical protein AX16_003195 [Volvariella volvacea WC 439]|nr:hypothetical protein AX16_003195 [Volvariella volvacea WC 439]